MTVGSAADPAWLAIGLRRGNACLFLLHPLAQWVLDHRCGVIAGNVAHQETLLASASHRHLCYCLCSQYSLNSRRAPCSAGELVCLTPSLWHSFNCAESKRDGVGGCG